MCPLLLLQHQLPLLPDDAARAAAANFAGSQGEAVETSCPGRGAARQRCTAEPGPRLSGEQMNRDPGSAAHHSASLHDAPRPGKATRPRSLDTENSAFSPRNLPESFCADKLPHMSRMLRSAIAALALCTTLPARAAVPADACAEVRTHDSSVGAEITDPRVLAALHDAITVSGLGVRVVPCWLTTPLFNATVDDLGSFYYVGVTRSLAAAASDAELRAVLGHEVAHIALGHRTTRFELTHHRTAGFEEGADALAAQWFGANAMLSVLMKLRTDAAKLPDAAERRLAIREIDARIHALEDAPPSVANIFGGGRLFFFQH